MIEFYTDKGGEIRWRAIAVNGLTVGASSEGFHDMQEAADNARRTHKALADWLGVPSEVTDPKTTPIDITD